MLLELNPDAGAAAAASLARRLSAVEGLRAWPLRLTARRFVVVSGDDRLVPPLGTAPVMARHGTERGYWLVDRANAVAPATVGIGGTMLGRNRPLWYAAGPCALERIDDGLETASRVKAAGAHALRGGLFKPRSSPYHFAGRGRAGLAELAEIGRSTGLPLVTEVLDPRDVDAVAEVADCLQVDARNMNNRVLLAELGRINRPVLLMRGLRARVADWLRAAEFIFATGNPNVVLCARGIVSFDDTLAFQPDLGALLELRRHTDLPVIFDPSHCGGNVGAVAPLALAAIVAGADGLLIETHVCPARMYRPGDADQMYPIDELANLFAACDQVRRVAAAVSGPPR